MCVLPLTYSGSESAELKYCDRTGIINFIRKKISIYKRRRKYRKTLKQASDRYVKFEEFLKKMHLEIERDFLQRMLLRLRVI